MRPLSSSATLFRLLGTLTAVLILSQFYRSTVAVIAPDLARDLNLGAEDLGILTGAFFAALAAMQLPTGILLDRFGPRRTIPFLLSLAVAGAVLFGTAPSFAGLVAGQVLMGAGCAGVFMGALVTLSRWVPPERFASVSSRALAVSGLGMILSGTPFALVTESIGWRDAYLGLAALTVVLTALVAVTVRDAPPDHPYHRQQPESLASVLRGVGRVFRHAPIYGVFAVAFIGHASSMSIRALWGGPYLADIHGLDTVARGNVLLIMSLGTMAGIMVYGPLDRVFRTRKYLVLGGGLIAVAALLAMALVPALSLAAAATLFVVLGAAGAFFLHLLSHGRAFFPDAMVGRIMTSINFVNFVGVGCVQIVTGLLIGAVSPEAGPAPEIAYRLVFGFLAVGFLFGLIAYSRSEDAPPGVAPRGRYAGPVAAPVDD